MELTEITQELNRRFAAPLPDFYPRRILVWKDEEGEFADKLEDLALENAKLVVLDGRNQFYAKKLIAREEKDSNLLLYCPLSYDDPEDNWLLDVELYSEVIRFDLLSSWLMEMGMDDTPSIREAVKKFRGFFSAAPHRRKVEAMEKHITKPAQVGLVVLAGLCGEKDPTPANILRRVMMGGAATADNAVYQAIVRNEAVDAFWDLAQQMTGYQKGKTPSMEQLTLHILMTACAQTMPAEYLRGLEKHISSAHKSACYDILHRWLNGPDKTAFVPVAEYVEETLALHQRFLALEARDLMDTECFPCIDGIILFKLMDEIGNNIINPDIIQDVVARRKTTAWYGEVEDFYEGLLQLANLYAFFSAHGDGFHTVEPQKIWQEYTGSYYLMDTYYRRFHCCYANIKLGEHFELEDAFKTVAAAAERLYAGWFLGQLGGSWSAACEAEMSAYGRISGVSQQTEFYRSHLFSDSVATAVIISDALRYEVAAELAKKLELENHGNVKQKSCEALFPTSTKYGMAALLPHETLSVERKGGALAVLADGIPTEMGYREKLLKRRSADSKLFRFKEFSNMSGPERRDAVRGISVVYIYHDVIDDAGHSGNASKVFGACDTAINELKKLVKDVVNCNIGRIFITADHGFLYTDAPLKESDKVAKSGFEKDAVELDSRYVLVNRGAAPDFLMPVKFLGGTTDYDAFAPRDSIRITSGGSKNYTHGGISLQELVVPIIEYGHVRTTTVEYKRNKSKYDTRPVTIEILSSARKTSNMIIPVNFFQKEAVGGNREAATYILHFEDGVGTTISDVQTIIADKEEPDNRSRQFRLTFHLKQARYDKDKAYFLVIEDKAGKQAPVRVPFVIDIAFTLGDFDFFV